MLHKTVVGYLSPALLCWLAAAGTHALETARVEVADGAPRIVIDGQPVRSRMFWGGFRSGALNVGPQAAEVRFEFVCRDDSQGRGTLHLRFGQQPGTIWIDALRIVDVESGADVLPNREFKDPALLGRDLIVWPTGEQNTVGQVTIAPGEGRDGRSAVKVVLRNPVKGTWPDFHIYTRSNLELKQGRRYRLEASLRADAPRKVVIDVYRPGQPFVRLGGAPGPFLEQVKLAADVGVHFVSFPMHLPWPKPGEKSDFASIDALCEDILRVNPQALLVPRLGTSPPQWWREAHRDQMMAWDEPPKPRNQTLKVEQVSVCSALWREELGRHMAALIEHCEAKFGPHMAGYHPCGQNTGEWFYENTWGHALNGYAPVDLAAWRNWLAKKYAGDAALRAAWGDKQVLLASVEVPAAATRRATPTGVLHEPRAQRALLDWAEFQQEAMADCVGQLAHVVRTATRGRKLVLFFYGYVFEFGPVDNGPATSGHYALRRALQCPDIDILCSPISYFDRGLAQSAPSMTAAESVALAGKLWLNEDDTRTYLGTGTAPGWRDGVSTLKDTNRELVRNVAQESLRNFGTWWMDLGSTGWFNDPGMWAELKRLEGLDRAMLAQPRAFRPEVAAVIDERSMHCVAARGPIATRPGIYEVRRPLGRMGAPYGQYLLDDLLADRVPGKLFVLLDAWRLDAVQRQQLLKALDGRPRIWCYAPGYIDDDRFSLEAMQQLTGFRLQPVDVDKAETQPTEVGRRLGLEEPFGVSSKVRPLFAAADARGDEVLATYADGSAAVAMRQTQQGLSIFVGPPGLTSQLLRLAAARAGVHLYTRSDCNLWANGPYVALHAASNGPVELDLGQSGTVRDMLSGETVGRGPRLVLPLQRGETRVLELRRWE